VRECRRARRQDHAADSSGSHGRSHTRAAPMGAITSSQRPRCSRTLYIAIRGRVESEAPPHSPADVRGSSQRKRSRFGCPAFTARSPARPYSSSAEGHGDQFQVSRAIRFPGGPGQRRGASTDHTRFLNAPDPWRVQANNLRFPKAATVHRVWAGPSLSTWDTRTKWTKTWRPVSV
jgi:hypothetical protein